MLEVGEAAGLGDDDTAEAKRQLEDELLAVMNAATGSATIGPAAARGRADGSAVREVLPTGLRACARLAVAAIENLQDEEAVPSRNRD